MELLRDLGNVLRYGSPGATALARDVSLTLALAEGNTDGALRRREAHQCCLDVAGELIQIAPAIRGGEAFGDHRVRIERPGFTVHPADVAVPAPQDLLQLPVDDGDDEGSLGGRALGLIRNRKQFQDDGLFEVADFVVAEAESPRPLPDKPDLP